jgi:hypothetical protein
MTTDVKLGMVVGLAVVLAVAVTYFPKTGTRGGAHAVVPSLPAVREADAPNGQQPDAAGRGRPEVADAR